MKHTLPKHTYYLDAISYFFMLAQIVILLLYWKGLDERVPIHFNLLGSPDGYGSKYVLWILPIVSILLFAGLKSFRFIKFNRYLAKFDKQLSMNLYKLYCSWTSLVSALTLFFLFYIALCLYTNSASRENSILYYYRVFRWIDSIGDCVWHNRILV